MSDFLPFARPSIGQEEIDEVCDSLRSGWLTTGPKAKQFESDFARFIGCAEAMAVNSATAGLHLALDAIGVGPGDKVITTTYTFTASAEVIRYLDADPLFVDVDADTMNIDVGQVAIALSSHDNVKAIIPVHFGGQAAEMGPLLDLAYRYNVKIVEDAAHALPATYQGRMVGSIGDITVFSFYVTKTLTTGEGGMVVTNNSEYADRIRIMRLHGIDRDVFDRYSSSKALWRYEVVAPGYKYNMPDLAAAIGLHQLRKVNEFQQRRRQIAEWYTHAFSDLPVRTPIVKYPDDLHAWHLYALLLRVEELSIDRNAFVERMKSEGIGTSVHFIPLHVHRYWRDRYSLSDEDYPVAADIYRREISLPIYPAMTDASVERVIAAVTSIVRESVRAHKKIV